jgi:hypothetical protein
VHFQPSQWVYFRLTFTIVFPGIDIENLGQWEKVVTQLSKHTDFESEETFFTVLGLLKEDELKAMRASLRHVLWPEKLPANADRELAIYHY